MANTPYYDAALVSKKESHVAVSLLVKSLWMLGFAFQA
jgi:hypothetical protein